MVIPRKKQAGLWVWYSPDVKVGEPTESSAWQYATFSRFSIDLLKFIENRGPR